MRFKDIRCGRNASKRTEVFLVCLQLLQPVHIADTIQTMSETFSKDHIEHNFLFINKKNSSSFFFCFIQLLNPMLILIYWHNFVLTYSV